MHTPIFMKCIFMKEKLNYCILSRVPWTSEEKESDMTMLIKSRIIAAKTLQTEWDTQVMFLSLFHVHFLPSRSHHVINMVLQSLGRL